MARTVLSCLVSPPTNGAQPRKPPSVSRVTRNEQHVQCWRAGLAGLRSTSMGPLPLGGSRLQPYSNRESLNTQIDWLAIACPLHFSAVNYLCGCPRADMQRKRRAAHTPIRRESVIEETSSDASPHAIRAARQERGGIVMSQA